MRALGTEAEPQPVAVIVRLAPGCTAQDLSDAGYTVTNDMGATVIVETDMDSVEALAGLQAVGTLTFGGKRKLKMDLARKAAHVDEVHDGFSLDGAFHSASGAGVLLGMMDTGFQASHVAFNDDAGATRINRLWHYKSWLPSNMSTYTPSNISGYSYDTRYESHATHVAGMMAGSYFGNGDYAYTPGAAGGALTIRRSQPMVYYGVAPESTLAFAVGDLYDAVILDGVEHVVDYGRSMGMPTVVNLSLGANLGPHDGTDEFTAALNDLGRDAIICISSGNEADMDMSITHTFESTATPLRTFIIPSADYDETSIDQPIDVWSADASPVTVTLYTYRISDGSMTQVATLSSAGSATISTKTGMTAGTGKMVAAKDANSGRYGVRISPSTAFATTSGFRMALEVKASKAGQKVNLYYGGYGDFMSYNVAGFTSGSADQSINCNAIGDNLLAVGSFNTRKYFAILSDSKYAYSTAGETPGAVSSFSSYGTNPKGEILPHILAPGSTIISSFNRYYVSYARAEDQMTGTAPNGTATDYWSAMDGTSMASPFMAGVIALWLEAVPTLDVQDIKDVLAHSGVTDSYTKAKPQSSRYGKVDALAGMKYLLANYASVGSITDDPAKRFMITADSPRSFSVTMAGEKEFAVTVTDLQGRAVMTVQGSDAGAHIDASELSAGVYIVTAQGALGTVSEKISVR